MKKYLLFLVVSLFFTSCTPKQWVLTNATTTAIPIDASTEQYADKEMQAYIEPIKQQLDKEMNQVIGESLHDMRAGKPESLLSNWSSDVYLLAASEFLKEQVDMSVVNMGSLRAPVLKGNISVGTIFQLMPFENELVILYLRGSEISKLFNIFALEGGQGIGGCSFEIKDNKAINCKIQGKAIEENKLYSIATNDFLAGGNDRMVPLATPEKRIDTGLKIRNILMAHIIRETQNGRKIDAKLDGRISNQN